jgi:RNA-directed DNA polymerase
LDHPPCLWSRWADVLLISPLLSNLYLNEVDRMLERAKAVTRYEWWIAVEYAQLADDLPILVDSHPRQQ